MQHIFELAILNPSDESLDTALTEDGVAHKRVVLQYRRSEPSILDCIRGLCFAYERSMARSPKQIAMSVDAYEKLIVELSYKKQTTVVPNEIFGLRIVLIFDGVDSNYINVFGSASDDYQVGKQRLLYEE